MPVSDTAVPTSALSARSKLLIALGYLLAWILLAGPLFLRMPLTNDTEVYDLQAAAYRTGSVLYRDFLEPNLPGVIWIHLAVRGVLGDSSEAMRLFDLAVFALTATLAGRLVRQAGGDVTVRVGTAFAMAAYYLTASEWCHCQRDVWMLCPALAAVSFRLNGLNTARIDRRFIRSFCEGMLWGTAVWLKPHVMIPAAMVWGVSLRYLTDRRTIACDAVGLLTGGLLIGALGIGWMMQVGCWEPFLDTMREWNPAYFRAGREHWTITRFVGMSLRQGPWLLFPAVGLIIALRLIWMRVGNPATDGNRGHAAVEMLAALFIGWLAQALFLQHLFDYVFAPTVLLAIILTTAALAPMPSFPEMALRLGLGFAVCLVWASPALRPARLSCWGDCWRRELSPRQRDALAHFPNPDRENLARVAAFLREANVTDCDVCFYNSDFVSLYRQLELRPPVRYTYFFETLQFFPQKRRELLAELQQSAPRFVVTDLVSVGMPLRDAEAVGPDGPQAPPPAYRRAPKDVYPWSCPVVYRAGTYLVHRVPDRVAERSSHEPRP